MSSPQSAEHVELSYLIHHPNTPGTAQMLDASIAIACSIMRCLCGPKWTPSEVTLSRDRPRVIGPYRAFFRVPIRFDAPHSALVFPASCLDQPIAGADPAARTHLMALAAELDAARPATVTELTIRALTRMVIATPPSSDKVAEVLGINPRRLRERLEAEGSSVKELLEDLRCELARQLLEDSRMPVGEIAATLHYSGPGAFSRAFGLDWQDSSAVEESCRSARTSCQRRRPSNTVKPSGQPAVGRFGQRFGCSATAISTSLRRMNQGVKGAL